MSLIISWLFNVRWWVFLIYAGALCYGLFRPESPPDPFNHFDKILHGMAFLGLGLITRFAFINSLGAKVWIALLISAPVSEYLQHYLQPYRSFSWLDVIANLTGILLALGVWLAAYHTIKSILQQPNKMKELTKLSK